MRTPTVAAFTLLLAWGVGWPAHAYLPHGHLHGFGTPFRGHGPYYGYPAHPHGAHYSYYYAYPYGPFAHRTSRFRLAFGHRGRHHGHGVHGYVLRGRR